MEAVRSESTCLFRRLTARLQRAVPEPLVAVGLFRNRRVNRLPMDLALGITDRTVYVFAMGPLHPDELVDVWDLGSVHATAEEHHLSWGVHVALADGRRFHLQARRVGASRVNGEAVRLLTGR